MIFTRRFLGLAGLVCGASLFVPAITALCSRGNTGQPWTAGPILAFAAAFAAAAAATAAILRGLRRAEPALDDWFVGQARFLDALPGHRVEAAIVGAAALSLFLELSVIRWQGSVFEFFAFYKNFTLLACFAGLGLGYALAWRDRIALGAVIPLLAWQFAFLIAVQAGMPESSLASIRTLPFREQLTMGANAARTLKEAVATYTFLSVAFLLTSLAFIPVGQLCGRLMQSRENLRSYGLNLIGSVSGVLLAFIASYLWTPPVVWYGLAFAVLLLFHARRPFSLAIGACVAIAALAILAWPVAPLRQRIYSPYQLLEVGSTARGLMEIRAAGAYYQRVHDFSPGAAVDGQLARIRDYYDLPYVVHGPAPAVAVVGAGSGNDVAAAVRAGAAAIDAIEIDPAILALGRANHPEHPYAQPQVHAIVNDARTFLRTTPHRYDLIVYGLLDSHTLLSHASSVRLDSFVYTVEGFRDARARLAQGGTLALSFSLITDDLGRKIDRMLQAAFGGQPPACVEGGYDASVTFFAGGSGPVRVPQDAIARMGFRECSGRFAEGADRTDASTDDWPFFYMPRRTYPTSYLVMIAMVLVLTVSLLASFGQRPTAGTWPFALLGAGFMLVETKGITEMGLTFGNTWQVIGIVICGILVMAFLANWIVHRAGIRRTLVPYVLLLATLAAGVLIAQGGGFSSTPAGRLATLAVLTGPLLFSGIVFSSLLATTPRIAEAMSANLFGAMCGGLLEYNSMYFGFRFLYLVAAALYLAAAVTSWRRGIVR